MTQDAKNRTEDVKQSVVEFKKTLSLVDSAIGTAMLHLQDLRDCFARIEKTFDGSLQEMKGDKKELLDGFIPGTNEPLKEDIRKLVYCFFELPWVRRWDILTRYLHAEYKVDASEAEQLRIALKRAKDEGKLKQLEEAVLKEHERIRR